MTHNHCKRWRHPVEAWFKAIAYSLILLRFEGYPCIFYADIYGAHYRDKGEDGNEYEIWLEKVEELEILMQARHNNAYGHTRDYFNHKNCIGWIREGDECTCRVRSIIIKRRRWL